MFIYVASVHPDFPSVFVFVCLFDYLFVGLYVLSVPIFYCLQITLSVILSSSVSMSDCVCVRFRSEREKLRPERDLERSFAQSESESESERE